MHERESTARELNETPRIVNLGRGVKILEITQTKPKKAEVIEFSGTTSFEAMVKKVKKNPGLRRLVATTMIGLTAAMGATAFSAATVREDDKPVIEFQEDVTPNVVRINPAVDNIVAVGATKIAPPVEITTPESNSELVESVSEAEKDPTIEIESIPGPEAAYELDFEFKPTTESTPEPASEPTSELVTSVVSEQSPSISNGTDIAMKTAFSEGAYNSENDARKLCDVIINRAVENGTSVGAEVAKPGQFQSYINGMNSNGNWGWNNYGTGTEKGGIGTERVQQIFMEELNKAILGQPLTYNYTNFRASGDGKTNVYW